MADHSNRWVLTETPESSFEKNFSVSWSVKLLGILWKYHRLCSSSLIFTSAPFPYYFCRRMFPTIRCSFFGFQEALLGQKFAIILDVVPCDNKRYQEIKRCRSCWNSSFDLQFFKKTIYVCMLWISHLTISGFVLDENV